MLSEKSAKQSEKNLAGLPGWAWAGWLPPRDKLNGSNRLHRTVLAIYNESKQK